MLSFTSAVVAATLVLAPAAHGWQGTDQRPAADRTAHSRSWTGDQTAATPATSAPATSTP